MDVTQALKDAENSVRDFISVVMTFKYGADWHKHSGVTEDRLARWTERKTAEEKRQLAGVVDERLIYYADFFDLRTILHKNWDLFAGALGEKKSFDVFWSELEKLRDPDAHRRELLPHQKHLILGISGEIRSRLVRFRSKMETEHDYYPRIESARDSLGNIWIPTTMPLKQVPTGMRLRPGDRIDFLITATDPMGENLDYGIRFGHVGDPHWEPSNQFSIIVQEKHVGNHFAVGLFVKSRREYHAGTYGDDDVHFIYIVLPPKI